MQIFPTKLYVTFQRPSFVQKFQVNANSKNCYIKFMICVCVYVCVCVCPGKNIYSEKSSFM